MGLVVTPILKSYEWRCVICDRKGKSYHPVQAFYDHYIPMHDTTVNPTTQQGKPVK